MQHVAAVWPENLWFPNTTNKPSKKTVPRVVISSVISQLAIQSLKPFQDPFEINKN